MKILTPTVLDKGNGKTNRLSLLLSISFLADANDNDCVADAQCQLINDSLIIICNIITDNLKFLHIFPLFMLFFL